MSCKVFIFIVLLCVVGTHADDEYAQTEKAQDDLEKPVKDKGTTYVKTKEENKVPTKHVKSYPVIAIGGFIKDQLEKIIHRIMIRLTGTSVTEDKAKSNK